MCGRFILTAPFSEIVRLYGITNVPNVAARYNIAPTDPVAVVRSNPETKVRTLDMLRWGLVPYWAKDVKIGASMINAKRETITEKPAFREAFERRRCIVLANGFYEWQKLGPKTKQPYAIVMKDRGLFGFAGLWERWKDKAGGDVTRSCTIVTTEPNEVCAPLHDRMPAILDPAGFAAWLGETSATKDELLGMLGPYPAERMEAYKVSSAVGNVRNDDATLIESLPAGI